MPIFEFVCSKCNERFEELVFGSECPPCPSCGAGQTEKQPSCPCLHMPAPSRVGQTVKFPRSAKNSCSGCAGGSCSTCK